MSHWVGDTMRALQFYKNIAGSPCGLFPTGTENYNLTEVIPARKSALTASRNKNCVLLSFW